MQRKRNIVLIGMPGAGKSTLGVLLAKIANMSFMDCDLLIQNTYEKTLQTLINERGIDGFLNLENEALSSISVENHVISTGGSAVYSPAAMEHLAECGVIVYLKISYSELVSRLGDLDERGVVMRSGKQGGLRALYDERKPLYEKFAQLTVDVDGLTVDAAAKKVLEQLGQHNTNA